MYLALFTQIFSVLNWQDVLEYKKKQRPQKIKMLDGAIKTIMVDDSKTVGELLVTICSRIGVCVLLFPGCLSCTALHSLGAVNGFSSKRSEFILPAMVHSCEFIVSPLCFRESTALSQESCRIVLSSPLMALSCSCCSRFQLWQSWAKVKMSV